MGLEVACLDGFYCHQVTTTSVPMHACCYTWYESGTKTGL